MKSTIYFLALLALAVLFAFACKAPEEADTDDDPIIGMQHPCDQWIQDATDFLDEWEEKVELSKLTFEEHEIFMEKYQRLIEDAEDFLIIADEEQAETIKNLHEHLDNLIKIEFGE